MSLDIKNKDRMERSCHLTLKQYNIILSYLNTGVKPPIRTLEDADLVGNLNGGVNKSGRYHRLKSIASRLALRPTDGALIFASNGKVVIPSSKFEEVIEKVHQSTGDQHLNASQTLAKLQETYTIGRRQFGICEDQIRDVVKSCNQGSCQNSRKHKKTAQISDYGTTPAKRKKKTEKMEKSVELTKEQGTQFLKSLLAANMYQSSGQKSVTTFIPNQSANLPQSLNYSPAQLENIQSKLISAPNCLLVINPTTTAVVPSSSLTDLHSFTSPPESVNNNILLITPLSVCTTSGTYSHSSALGNKKNLGQIQPKTVNVQPKLTSSLLLVQNLMTPVSAVSQSGIKLLYTPALSAQSSTKSCKEIKSTSCPAASLSDVNSFINSFSSSVDENNNFQASEWSSSTILDGNDDPSLPRFSCIEGSDLALTVTEDLGLSQNTDPCRNEDEDTRPPGSKDDQVVVDNVDSPKDDVPFPHIWHYYEDFRSERNPYQKIFIGIQDMKLDLLKSLVGDTISAERLKKKISYIEQLVKTQKTVTEPYKMDLN